VTSRLLAFALAFIIGSPTCWCCVPCHATPPETASHSCCHDETAPGAQDKSAPEPECPCAHSVIKRDLAEGKVLVPVLAATPVMDVAWLPVSDLPPAPTMVRGLPPAESKPPWWTQQLYLRDCRLLL
jgi:hypothetical protein